MTQPEKWDEIAEACVSEWKSRDQPTYGDMYEVIAAALRSAYAQGERAGMERAENIAVSLAVSQANTRDEYEDGTEDWQIYNQGAFICMEAAETIRAAKEIKP